MNIVKREFKTNLKTLILWIMPLILIHYGASIEFMAFEGNEEIAEAMSEFEALFSALGSSSADMTTPEGFISMMSIYIYLPLAIYSGLLGSNIISKEEKNKTAEYLFTLPVKRSAVIRAKSIIAFLNTIIINLAIMIFIYITYLQFDVSDFYLGFFINMSIGIFFTQIIFLTIGMLLSAGLKQYKKSGSITIGILIGTYMISILISIVGENIEFLKYFIPFLYFPTSEMLIGNFEIVYIVITVVVVISSIFGTFYFYKKRDLYI